MTGRKPQGRPTPRNEAVELDKHAIILSRTNLTGIIEYGNEYFFQISGYDKSELIGKSHNILRHPDMPRVIFKVMWQRLKKGQAMHVVIKNMAKDGRYYWVTTHFEIKHHPADENKVVGYMAIRKAASEETVKIMEPLYKTLKKIERERDIVAAEQYLFDYMASKRMNYDKFLDKAISAGEKSGFLSRLFKK